VTDAFAKLREPVAVPTVLMYHAVDGFADPYRIAVTPDRFARQMRWLERRGLRGTSMRELVEAADRGEPQGLVGLTFDDGYAGFVTDVVPVLRRHGFGATVYVVAGKFGGCNDWDAPGPVRPLMTAEDVRMAARAGIEIGSHGWDHVHLTKLDADTVEREIRHSRTVLESVTGHDITGFCYPYGDVSDDVVGAVRSAGYDYAVATRQSSARYRYALPRIYVGQRDGSLRLWAKWIRHRLGWGTTR
jgi:peptidoglycan/xylan/chitin deacetylase (PgdA/CDA1 family)